LLTTLGFPIKRAKARSVGHGKPTFAEPLNMSSSHALATSRRGDSGVWA
jgi:hypothetical protein